ncbi:hypothetical protein GOBAR_DD31670 [Gossypium barbadense]|nr:hypothetical protein GOBAR_DD31670 [Gossypium barbadense]
MHFSINETGGFGWVIGYGNTAVFTLTVVKRTAHVITFINEDGDIATLMDDNDLYIVMRQHLKIFRIDVQLNTDRLGKPCALASQSSTPLRLPSLQPPSEGFNVAAADSSKQPVASCGNPCTTIDVFDPDPLRDGVLRVVIPEIYRC